ncbi:MAG TPA: ribosome-associated translation inhibitor RaiA [Kaistia sp.]|nr:ribosome-associated translation inhibitor RaiA [Kaistia sp.]
MHVTVTGKQIDVGEALRTRVIDELAAAVEKYFSRAIEAQVTFSRDGAAFYRSDIAVHVGRGIDLYGHASANDPTVAFELAQERIAKRLRRHKRRLRDHKGAVDDAAAAPEAPDGAMLAQYVIQADDDVDTDGAEGGENGDQPVIIAETTSVIPTIAVGEAVMRMDLADSPVLVFRNGGHGGLNVVYRRKDGNIGWIDSGPSGKS